ncbi:MAG: TolC family protein, partial [Candidatus Poribacteria bacterium]|nr:TolC family protein [Candidatus Poribacteria bacterium]
MGKRIAVIQAKAYIALIFGLLISIKVGFLMPTFAEIEAVDLSTPLTLEQCLQLALENSTSVKNNQISLAIQNLRIKDAESNFYPNFSLSGNYTLSDQLRRMQRQRENLDKDTFVLLEQGENYNFGLTGQYTIWDFGQRWLNLLQEKESLESQESRNERTRQSLIYEVTQAYYEVLKSQALVAVNKEILQRSRDNRQRVEA